MSGTSVDTRPTTSWTARGAAVVRIIVGLFFVSSGLSKFMEHAQWAADFARWNVPLPELAAFAVAGLETVGGLALALGVAARLIAAALTVTMIGAVLTAGLVDGGQHLLLPPVLGVLTALIAVRGARAWQARRGMPLDRLRS